jgi:hypothetical protein
MPLPMRWVAASSAISPARPGGRLARSSPKILRASSIRGEAEGHALEAMAVSVRTRLARKKDLSADGWTLTRAVPRSTAGGRRP